jgi:hypothetical protein
LHFSAAPASAHNPRHSQPIARHQQTGPSDGRPIQAAPAHLEKEKEKAKEKVKEKETEKKKEKAKEKDLAAHPQAQACHLTLAKPVRKP